MYVAEFLLLYRMRTASCSPIHIKAKTRPGNKAILYINTIAVHVHADVTDWSYIMLSPDFLFPRFLVFPPPFPATFHIALSCAS